MLPVSLRQRRDAVTTEEDRAPLSSEVKRPATDVSPHSHAPFLHFRLFDQLKQRNVFRVAALYLVVCWLILEPVHVVFHMLDVPIWANRLVVMTMAVGFPAVVIFAWVYEITPEGLKPTAEIPHGQSIRRLTGRRLDMAIIAVLVLALGYFVLDKFWISKHVAGPQPVASAAPETAARMSAPPQGPAFSPPPHSIAVLPFVNMSGDKEQEYFSDGLTEELLNSLAEINELQVAARTSAFSFKGKDTDIGTIARKLNVGAVLEGSVRRSGNTVRITTQLINGVTGFHAWSGVYDRDLGDVLKLETEIAGAVASALKVSLLGDVASKIELGGTHNPAAFDAYLRATQSFRDRHAKNSLEAAIENYTKATELDPNYALAYASRSIAYAYFAFDYATGPSMRAYTDKAEADARKALALAPDFALGHLALGSALETALDFWGARPEYERAINLEPGNATIQQWYGFFAACMGAAGGGLSALRRALTLDPLNAAAHNELGVGLLLGRRYEEAIEVLKTGHSLHPQDSSFAVNIGVAQNALGDYEGALKSCEQEDDNPFLPMCLAIAYDKLGRRADAEAMLKRIPGSEGVAPFLYTLIFAQWGQTNRALDSLETAMRQRSPYLEQLKMLTGFDPIRKEPRFQAIERALKFPD